MISTLSEDMFHHHHHRHHYRHRHLLPLRGFGLNDEGRVRALDDVRDLATPLLSAGCPRCNSGFLIGEGESTEREW